MSGVISLITCLQVLIWFSIIALGRSLGLPEEDDILEDHGNLIPSDARLIVSSTRTRKPVFLFTAEKTNLASLIIFGTALR